MSKKQPGSKRQQRKEASNIQEPVSRQKQAVTRGSARKPHPMLNLLLLFSAIMPFMFSWELMDSNLTVRYGLMGGFVLVFLLYFYGFRKKLFTAGWPLLVKLAFIAGAGFAAWNLVSFFSATNAQQAYYGISRYFLYILLLFIISQVAVEEEGYLLRICKLLSIAAILHSLVGVCQYYDIAFNDLPGNFKPYGFMANRNLYGTAQVMLLPFAIYTLYKSSKTWKYLAAIAIAGIAISSILSQTRSSWLAAIVSALAGLVLVAVFDKENRKKWLVGTAAGFISVIALAFLLIKADGGGELSQSLRERTTNILGTDTTGEASSAAANVGERLKIWAKTKEVIADNWLTGVGAGNWKVMVPKYGSEGLAWAKGKYVPDTPHNDYLLVMAEAGIPGFLLYFGMWILIGLTAFATIRKTQSADRRILNIVMLGGLAGMAVDSFFSFPLERMEHGLYMYLMGGIILGTAINQFASEPRKQAFKGWQLAVMALIAAFNLFLSTQKYSFEKHLVRAKGYENAKMFPQSVEEANKGKNAFVSIATNGFPIETYSGLSYKELKDYPAALREFNKGLEYHPYNKALYINIGTVYTVMNKYDTAIQYYNKALALTPEFDVCYFNLAMNYFMLKDYKKCLEMLNKTEIGDNKDLRNIKMQAEAMVAQQSQGNTPVQQ